MNAQNGMKNRRVLIVDDNRAIHDDFRKILTTGGGGAKGLDEAEAALFSETTVKVRSARFELESAFQGQEGLALVQQAAKDKRPFAMAFIDVRMPPGWDGIETTAKIWEVDPDLQVVICTAYSDYSWDDMIAKVGVSDRLVILKKPFDNVEVLQLANALTEKWSLLQQSKLQFKDLERMVTLRTLELHRTEERFRLIAEHAADLIAVVDPKVRYLYTSPSFQNVLGCSPEELRGACALDRVHPDELPAAAAAIQACFRDGVHLVLEYRLRHGDGSWRAFESHCAPVRNPGGEVEQMVVVARDITDRKLAEADRQRMEIQLRQAQKLESIGQLAAGIAHEINTPTQYIGDNTRFVQDAFGDLNPLLSQFARLLEAVKAGAVPPALVAEVEAAAAAADVDYLSAEIPKAIQQTLDGNERVAKIVRAMKEFSHPGTEDKTPIDLNHAIESTLTVARNEWKYVAEVVTEFDAELPAVPCLPGEFNQVILNLIVNAAHAIADVVGDGAKGKGTITVSTRRCGERVEVRIGDTGTGIPEKARDRVFDPFFTTKPVGKGTGQGLAIARSVIVDKHGGTISFETETGRGTTFIIHLPTTDKAANSRRSAA